jgi:hypothetical protein
MSSPFSRIAPIAPMAVRSFDPNTAVGNLPDARIRIIA